MQAVEESVNIGTLKSQLLKAIDDLNVEKEVPNWKPILDRILCLPLTENDYSQSNSGLYVPPEDKPWRHLVVSVSDAVKEDIIPGDVVVTGKFIGEPVNFAGVDYRLVRQNDILAILLGE